MLELNAKDRPGTVSVWNARSLSMDNAFEFQPTLTGPRLMVRSIASADWDEMFVAAGDPEIWATHPASDRYLESEFREFFDSALASGSAFAFVDRRNGRIIGSSRYHGHNIAASEIEIGWTFLTRQYWGGSYNWEVKRLMLGHAFKWVDRVVFWVGETNWRSRRAMEKIGGVLRGGVEHRVGGGRNLVHVVYEIRKDRYGQ